MLLSSRTPLDPVLTVATEPVALTDRALRLAVVGLGIAGLLPPLAFSVMPGDVGRIAGIPIAVALTALLILMPALCGLVIAASGLERVRESCHIRGDREYTEAAFRICVGVFAVCYGLAMAMAAPSTETTAALIVASLGLAGGWMLLLLAILDSMPSSRRHYAAVVFDAVIVSAFLHFGGELTAPWVLTYLLTTFHAGFRGGVMLLAVSAIINLAGFATVVMTTAYWQDQPQLAGGLAAALAALPAYVAGKVREVAASREEAVAAREGRAQFLLIISQALRAPLDALIGGPRLEAPTAVPAARTLLSQVSNVLDFTAIEAGAFVPTIEGFDLHRLVNDTLAERRSEAAAKGVRLRTHIDPTLPHRLRGWPQQLAQILDFLVSRAIDVTGEGTVRVSIDAAGGDNRRARLRLVVRDGGPAIAPTETRTLFDPFVGPSGASLANGSSPTRGNGAFGLAVVRRLVELMGGEIDVGRAETGGSFTIEVFLAVDERAGEAQLDLEGCLVLIATEDSQFASDLAEPLNAWNGEPQWIDSFDKTLDFAEHGAARACSVLIVDGRRRKLAALSFAHRAAIGAAAPSFVLFVADAGQIGGLMKLAEDELDAVLPAPLDDRLLANALHALPLWHGAPARPVIVPPVREADATVDPPPLFDPVAELAAPPQVTPIVTHPRFAAEAAIVDPRAIAALRGLGGGDEFLGEVLDSFRVEGRQIMQRLVRATASADSEGFARGLHALRSCAANLGGMRLCEVLLSLREVDAQELRERGGALVQRLADELGRLDAELAEFLPTSGERRSGWRS